MNSSLPTLTNGTLRAGIGQWYPWISYNKSNVGEMYDLKGPMASILHHFSSTINVKFCYYEASDGEWGKIRSDGSYSGMIGMVHRNEVDLAVGPFSIDHVRGLAVEFSNSIYFDSIAILVGKQDETKAIFTFLPVFHPTVWFMLLLVSQTLVFMYALIGCFQIQKFKVSIKVMDAYMEFLAPLVGSCYPEMPNKRFSQKCILTFWKLGSRFLSLAISTVLLSFLIVSKPGNFIKSFSDFDTFPDSIPLFEKGSNTINMFEYGESSVTQKIWKRVQENPTRSLVPYQNLHSNEYLSRILLQREYFAVIDYTTGVTLLNNRFIEKLECGFHLTEQLEYGNAAAIALNRFLPAKTRESLTYLTLHLVENGLIQQDIHKSSEHYINCLQRIEKNDISQIKASDVIGIFIIYLCGISVAIILRFLGRFSLQTLNVSKILPLNEKSTVEKFPKQY